jgi:peptidoglycan/xylan/chitin deacetylase (PgdA/CDA1 family)
MPVTRLLVMVNIALAGCVVLVLLFGYLPRLLQRPAPPPVVAAEAPTIPPLTLVNAPGVLAAATPTVPLAGAPPAVQMVAPVATVTHTPEALATPGAVTPIAPDVGSANAACCVAATPPPILMYHYVRVVDRHSDPLGYALSVTPEMFNAQMAWLHMHGYSGITMAQALGCMRGERCPPKPVALTFDDGYQDAYDQAFPTLQRYGFRATFYIISGFVNHPHYATWDEIRAMLHAGMEIGAHTIHHLDLTHIGPAEAAHEIGGSKAAIEHELGTTVTSFCYPSGRYNAAIEALVRQAGYASATTTRWDDNYSDPLALPRRRVSGDTTLEGFAALVGGG